MCSLCEPLSIILLHPASIWYAVACCAVQAGAASLGPLEEYRVTQPVRTICVAFGSHSTPISVDTQCIKSVCQTCDATKPHPCKPYLPACDGLDAAVNERPAGRPQAHETSSVCSSARCVPAIYECRDAVCKPIFQIFGCSGWLAHVFPSPIAAAICKHQLPTHMEF